MCMFWASTANRPPPFIASLALTQRLSKAERFFIGFHDALDQLQIAHDIRQQIVEIMGETAGELANCFQVLSLLEMLFNPPGFCNVFNRG